MSFFCLQCRESDKRLLGKEISSNLVFCREASSSCQKSWHTVGALTGVTDTDKYIYLYLPPLDLISVAQTETIAKSKISSFDFMLLYLKTWLKKLNEFGFPDIWRYRKDLIRFCGWNTPKHLSFIYHLFQVGDEDLLDMNVLKFILKEDSGFDYFIPTDLDYVQSVVAKLVEQEKKKLFLTFLSRVSLRIIPKIEIELEKELTPIRIEMIQMLRKMQE